MLKKIRSKLKWLDPFTYVDIYLMPKLNPNENEAISWIVYLACAFIFAWLIYTGLGLLLGTASPMMIVVSASMEPLYHRGDIIILHGAQANSLEGPIVESGLPSLREKELASFASLSYSGGQLDSISFDSGQNLGITKDGSVVVYWSTHLRKPVVHRAVAKLHAGDGWYVLTKGDSKQNSTLDQDCGLILNGSPEKECIELYPVPLENLQGKAFFHVPIVGCVKLWLLDDLGSLLSTGRLPAEYREGNFC